jgi:hypothetical protein
VLGSSSENSHRKGWASFSGSFSDPVIVHDVNRPVARSCVDHEAITKRTSTRRCSSTSKERIEVEAHVPGRSPLAGDHHGRQGIAAVFGGSCRCWTRRHGWSRSTTVDQGIQRAPTEII